MLQKSSSTSPGHGSARGLWFLSSFFALFMFLFCFVLKCFNFRGVCVLFQKDGVGHCASKQNFWGSCVWDSCCWEAPADPGAVMSANIEFLFLQLQSGDPSEIRRLLRKELKQEILETKAGKMKKMWLWKWREKLFGFFCRRNWLELLTQCSDLSYSDVICDEN